MKLATAFILMVVALVCAILTVLQVISVIPLWSEWSDAITLIGAFLSLGLGWMIFSKHE